MPHFKHNEQIAFDRLRAKDEKLRVFFSSTHPPQTDDPQAWYRYFSLLKEDLGNIHNDVSLLATLMAKVFLLDRFDLHDYDAASKPQGAPGLDIDACTRQGHRIVAEVKTTSPYKSGDLGASQADSFSVDARKLRNSEADFKFLFVTERDTFEVLKKPKYRHSFMGTRVVLLPGGDEIEQ